MPEPTHSMELLAPAGNLECLHAAVSAGADAVYLGLDEFNARRNAGNFTMESLAGACDYAHLRGVRVFVTLNVELFSSEVRRALDCAKHAYLAGADAFIVQDIGLAAALRRELPEAEVHASTQMNVHSAAGIEAVANLGAQRVTLARELSLAEIEELCAVAADFDMEVECFAHGALCICYSGQCLMSSMIGGRSANRGLCAQACRLPYSLHREGREEALPAEGEHLLSPRDLCSIGLLDELRQAGVASLKIEGRMKSPDYVHEVVSVYREALDELDGPQGMVSNVKGKRSRLAEAFSRGFTTGYLEGERGNDLMSYGRPNNRGVFVGRVSHVDDGVAEVAVDVALNGGDVVEFWTNKGHFAAPVPEGAGGGGRTARIPVERRVGKGDRVFRVRNAATAFHDDPLEPRIPVHGQVTLRVGELSRARFRASDGHVGEASGAVVETARTKPLTVDDVRAHVDRLGQTPYSVRELDISLDDNVGMGFSQLHRLRADALDALSASLLEPYASRTLKAAAAERADTTRGAARKRTCEVMAWATNPGCARAVKREGANGVYVPLLNFRRGQSQLCGVRQEQAEQAGYPKQCIMALPTVDHDPVAGTREETLAFDPWDYVREGKSVFADSMGSAIRALAMGARVELGPHVPIVNAEALQVAAGLGISRVWLSPELTLGQIAELAENSPVDLGLFVSGAQELMVCKHCLLMSQGPCSEECERCPRRSVAHHLTDRKGFDFPVVTDMLGRSHLYNGIELDAVPTVPDLVDMGVTAIMVDTTLMDKKAAASAVARAMRAVAAALEGHRSLDKRPHTTTGHLFRGVS